MGLVELDRTLQHLAWRLYNTRLPYRAMSPWLCQRPLPARRGRSWGKGDSPIFAETKIGTVPRGLGPAHHQRRALRRSGAGTGPAGPAIAQLRLPTRLRVPEGRAVRRDAEVGRRPALRLGHDEPHDFSPVKRLAGIVRSEGYRLMHTHTARSALVGCIVSWLTGVPMVHHVHSPTTCDTTHRLRNWMNCLAERLVLRRARRSSPSPRPWDAMSANRASAYTSFPMACPAGRPCRRAIRPSAIGRWA